MLKIKQICGIIVIIILFTVIIALNSFLKNHDQVYCVYKWLFSGLFIPLLYMIDTIFFNHRLLPNTSILIAVCVGMILGILNLDNLLQKCGIQKIAIVLISTFIIWICFYRKKQI